ncbi:hypothetical protein PPERSA_08583 [Pseudocohnilembus persalinus]|uniref:Uncharacterized protein n=1 Tax=Pseudocohnilembus persalinus TaxID=266149 RepID=A0A0V0R6P0_PSEPJ|nr:hypothetical protein PPERSA_08583 [Pseudocohnilembus persalinus]|eukprot:KRX10180.1 hypothetical protein PPERSA_08583 [Pseudocohnilembus persalinus]
MHLNIYIYQFEKNIVFPRLDFIDNIVRGDFFVFQNTRNNQFSHTESNRFEFRFLVPNQSVEGDFFKDSFGQGGQILFDFVNFNVENENSFGNGIFFSFFGLVSSDQFGSFSFFFSFGFFVFFRVVSEKVDVIVFFFLLFFGLFSFFSLLSSGPRGDFSGREHIDPSVPGVQSGEFGLFGDDVFGLQGLEDLSVGGVGFILSRQIGIRKRFNGLYF